MNTGAWKIGASVTVAFCLLMLAGIMADMRSALAQEACPLPAGETPPADPPVTAQQVEDGTATLAQFAQAATAQFELTTSETLTTQQLAYSGCQLRLEGGPWRSGSTYIVTLSLDGRVLIHAKDMSLSAGKLSPRIYGTILQTLGVDLTDPSTIATARSRTGALFSVPNVPGASGYASIYVSSSSQRPSMLLTGFDLTAAHLADETIDYGNPAITASDVVDRETLKAFVTEALRFLISTQRGVTSTLESRTAFAKARLALRDPNGPWRHGSVYLYILDRTSNVILFHGAFPDRFELKPLVPTVKDIVTGEFVLPQVIEAATSSPQGGFVEYYFDDPTDDTDSADIPKLGYARQFARTITTSGGTEITTNLIIGSGVYGRAAPEAVASDHNAVIESVLPQVMRAMTASTVDAVSRRIDAAGSAAAATQEMSLGGASTLEDVLMANGQALANGTFDPGQLLAGSSFTLPLGAAETQGTGPLGNLTLWGSGDWRNISGGNSQSVDYDGSVLSANLGIDTRLSAELLAGVSLGRSRGTVDYTASGVAGEMTTTVTSLAPYAGWQAPGGMSLWAMAGQGWGEVEIEDASGTQSSDLVQRMAAAGLSGTLVSSDEMITGGTTRLRVKGDAAFTETEVDGAGTIAAVELEAGRHRLLVEGSHTRRLASGALFTPSVEVGMRNDVGDGETGSGVEAGGGVTEKLMNA
ncbi:MAG: autotransporter domain-containing protein [bacterium]|nr:autotransporter domain-containing protein [bacterium]